MSIVLCVKLGAPLAPMRDEMREKADSMAICIVKVEDMPERQSMNAASVGLLARIIG